MSWVQHVAIEGIRLNVEQVRSSIARKQGIENVQKLVDALDEAAASVTTILNKSFF